MQERYVKVRKDVTHLLGSDARLLELLSPHKLCSNSSS